jgi:branched-chain amino acid transport system substrate-binding protein
VQPPGLDQKATWLRVKVAQPDWVILRSGGVMTTMALKQAAQVGFPRDKMVGPHPTCAERDVVPAGEAAIGFICASLHGTGRDFPLIQDILTYVYARGGLMSYAADLVDLTRRAAAYIDKILLGATPADLPVEQASKYELVINLKTAQALGLTLPPMILFQANEILR